MPKDVTSCLNWSVVSARGRSNLEDRQSTCWVLVVSKHNNTRHFALSLLLCWAFKLQLAVQDCQVCWPPVLVFPTWGCVSRLQSCFSFKTKYQQKWTLCIFWEQINPSCPATECFVKNTLGDFICRCFKWTCVSYRPSSCTLLVFMLSAGRSSHKLDRHELDITETAPVDEMFLFHFLTETILPVL